MSDKRKKGCPNEECSQHYKKIKMKSEYMYCPICGSELVYVCSKCFDEIEDSGPKHKICKRCEIEAKEKRDKVVANVKGAGITIATGVGKALLTDAKKSTVKQSAELVKTAVKTVVKKG